MKKYCFTIAAFFVSCVCALAACFTLKTDKPALDYKVGEKMKFSVMLLEDDGTPIVGKPLSWRIDADDGQRAIMGTAVSGKEPLELEASISKPGFVRVTVFCRNPDGSPVYKISYWGRTEELSCIGGAGADVAKLKSTTEEPADFDAFWKRQIAAQKKIPMKPVLKKLDNPDFDVYDVTIPALGTPAKGYLTIPKGAKKKSLPARVYFFGYDVDKQGPHFDKNEIRLTIERHTMELGQPKEYYDKLKAKGGALYRFGLDAEANKDPENAYFKFMIMRDLRGIEFVKTVPQWNGKDIIVQGGSMGGFQSIFVAAFSRDVTECRPGIPWLSDIWAAENCKGRISSTFHPEWTPSMRYFDTTFAIKRVKCPIFISAWLGDYCCPPAGVLTLYNNAPKNTELRMGQNGTHGYRPAISSGVSVLSK